MRQLYIFIFSIFLFYTPSQSQELADLSIESLFYGFGMNTPEQIKFVNGLENKRVWNYEPDIIKMHPETIKNPDKIRFVSVSYKSAEDFKNAIETLRKFPNLEYLEIKAATQFRQEDVKKELVLPKDLSAIEGVKFLNISGSYEIDFYRFFERLKKLSHLEYFSFGHHPKDVVVPDNFVDLKQLKGIRIQGFKDFNLPKELSKMTNLSTVILYVEGFKDLSAELEKIARLPDLKDLSLRYVDFDSDEYAALASMKNLETLELFNSKFDDLQDLFDILPEDNHLNKLRLINLATIKSPVDYSKLKNLEELNIQNTNDSHFEPAKDLFNLTHLKFLGISESQNFSKLPSEIGKLKNLVHLSLYSNNIESLPSEIGRLEQLETLNLRGNQLNSLPDEVEYLRNLKSLDISGNDLRTLPDEMTKMTNLEEFQAKENDLETLPDRIGDLRRLRILGLEQNRLKSLPESITHLKNLQELTLTENDLVNLPEEIGNLSNITEMPLGGNFLEELPDSFTKLIKLKALDVTDNNLERLPGKMGNLVELEKLYAGNSRNRRITYYEGLTPKVDTTRRPRLRNQIKTLPESLSRLSNVKRLNFSELQNIDSENFFNVLFDLESKKFQLDLSSSGITSLPENGWEDFQVEELILGGNIISHIPEDIINAPYLNFLSLRRSKKDRMGYSYRGKEQLNAFFEEEGFIPFEELPKTSAMAEAYLSNSYNQKFSGAPEEMLEMMKKAFALDSLYTAKHIRKDAYAEALLAGKAYQEAVGYFTRAIQEDTVRGLRILNFIIPEFRQRAEAYLGLGDTLSAIEDLRFVSSRFNANDWGDAGLLAKKIQNDPLADELFEEGIDFYQKQITWNAENDRVDYGYQLSLLELYIVSGKTSEAKEYLEVLKSLDIPSERNQILLQYFDLILSTLEGKVNQKEIEEFDPSVEIKGWSFELFNNWLKQTDLSTQKKEKINTLNSRIHEDK
ncbi:MAG: hypothetical protein WBL27_01135 [Salinimicrobium sp.]